MTAAGVRRPRPVTPAGILAAQLVEIQLRVDALAGADPELRELRELVSRAAELAGGLDGYLEEVTTPASAALEELARRTATEDWDARNAALGDSGADVPPVEQEMLSGHLEGQFLKLLVHATRASRVLEIGMFTGYSALAMAEALGPDGELIACEINPEVAAFAQESFAASPAGGKISVRVGPARRTLAALASAGQRFDLIFLDADKAGYAGYVDDVLDGQLLSAHGLLCIDNTLLQGQPWTSSPSSANGEAIASFNRRLAADPRVEQVVVPIRDGITLLRRVDHSGQAARA